MVRMTHPTAAWYLPRPQLFKNPVIHLVRPPSDAPSIKADQSADLSGKKRGWSTEN